jgi:hypothetical protein
MSETVILDASALSPAPAVRTQLDVTNWVSATGTGPDWGDGAIQAYMADMAVGSSPVDYRIPNRQISIPLNLQTLGGTSFATINTQLQQKVALLQREGGWIMRTVGGTNLYADVVSATLHLGGSWFQAFRNFDVDAVLSLECIPDWYGDEVTLDTLSGTTAVTAVLLQSAGTAVVAGNHPGRVRLQVSDTSANDQHGLLWGFRARNYSGSATAALSYEAETMTALNGASTAALSGASGGTAITSSTAFPADVWVPMLYTNLTAGAAPLTHAGTYRTWARCYATTSAGAAAPQFQLQWGVGALSVPTTNDPVRLPGTAAFYMLDLGTVSITPPPTGPTQWFGVVQTQIDVANDFAAIDRVFFQPLDESAGKLQYVNVPPASSISTISNAGTVANDAAIGTVAWTNPSNAKVKDATYATLALTSGQVTQWLKGTTYGFAIPTGATIKGIQTDMWWTATGGSYSNVRTMRLVKAGTVQSGTPSTTLNTPGTEFLFTAGGPTDLWGTTWTAADVNNSGFGSAFSWTCTSGSFNGFVDSLQITVYYTLSSGLTVAQDAVIYASKTAELRTDGMFRSDSGGTIYAPVSQVIGDLPRVPPSGLESRPIQVFVKPTRGDLDQLADGGLDGLSVIPKVRPSYLFRP